MITIHGIPQLRAALAAKAARGRAAAPQAAKAGADKLEQAAKGIAPRLTGHLIANITSGGAGAMAEVRASAHYSGYQEYGTSKMAAQPFMGPGSKAAAPQYYQEASRIFAAALI